MAKIEIYTQPFCGYCHRAKRLLDERGVAYEEIDLGTHPSRRDEMLRRSDGRYTVPQIFIDGKGIGGCDELSGLARTGQLDRLLTPGG